MKAIRQTLLAGACLFLLFSCGPKRLPAAEFVQWMENEDNHLRQTKNEGGVTYILQYKNMDYVLAGKRNTVFDETEDRAKVKADAEKSLLFDLYITCDNGKASPLQYRVTTPEEMNARYYYYHFRFVDDVYLEAGDKKIKPLYCIADKGSGLNNALAFSIGFERKEINDGDFRLVVNDTRLGTGTVKFLFKNTYIQHIPQIKTDA